jgi:AraC family transcriptional regulator, transcriptional activator FtrA
MRAPLVAVVAYDDLCTFEFGCAVEIFSVRRRGIDVPWYNFGVCAATRSPLGAAGGVRFIAPHSLRLLDRANTIVIPGWRPAVPPPRVLIRKLQHAYARGARLCSICSGTFVLAATGLLDGKPATTHWMHVALLRERYPEIEVRGNELYVDTGRIITSAGAAAGLDMMLHVVRLDHGAKIANLVAQSLVIPAHRDGGQAQFLPRAVPLNGSHPIAPLLEWVRVNLKAKHDLRSLARRSGVSERTLQRQFRDATGLWPTQWIVHERVARAKDTLETTRAPLWAVADACGFGAEESFRHHFRRIVGTSPGRYRRRFSQLPTDGGGKSG